MKRPYFLLFFLFGCIQTDLQDPFAPVLRLDNSLEELVFRVNGSYPLVAIYEDETGQPTDATITWSSSNEETLSFTDNVAMPHQEGLVLITASFNNLSETFSVDIQPSREMISISVSSPQVQTGTTTNFSSIYIDPDGKTIDVDPIWSSSDPNIATIDNSGLLNALSEGVTTVTASFGTVSAELSIEVINEEVIVEPEIKITAFAMFLNVADEFQFEADYINENGEVDESVSINWTSSNESILSIDENGLASAISAGNSTVQASFQDVMTSVDVIVEGGEVTERTGTLMGTGYDIEGAFSLTRNEDGDLILTVTGYKPDGPGPYFYLTNQNTNVNNGVNLGEARTGGDVTINVTSIDASVGLSSFDYLMVWCEPFSVRLGVGEFEN